MTLRQGPAFVGAAFGYDVDGHERHGPPVVDHNVKPMVTAGDVDQLLQIKARVQQQQRQRKDDGDGSSSDATFPYVKEEDRREISEPMENVVLYAKGEASIKASVGGRGGATTKAKQKYRHYAFDPRTGEVESD